MFIIGDVCHKGRGGESSTRLLSGDVDLTRNRTDKHTMLLTYIYYCVVVVVVVVVVIKCMYSISIIKCLCT